MKSSKSLPALNQKYRGKPKKYADGGRVRRPAAAPVASPFDADYIERLAAQAIGSGEPVTELRSAEGRGFAPMPRDATEALQRMAAVVRGDVEPTPEEERQISHVRGFTEGPAAIRAFHASPHRFEQFKPSEFRRASFFASTPERARIGAGSGASEMVMETSTKLPRQNLNIYEVDIDPSKIRGLHYTPEEIEWFNSLPARIKGDEDFERIWRSKPRGVDVRDWEDIYTPTQIGPREYIYSRKDVPPILSYEDAISRNRDVYGSQHSHYNLGADEKAAAEIARQRGMGGYLVNDEAGLSIGVIDPNIVNIVRRYAKGGLAALDEKYAEGGTVRAPKETTIAGQDHRLAYITPEEAALLKARGGSGRMTKHGIRAYDEGNGDGNGNGNNSDNANSNSEASTQDAAGGNQGQGAGPTGAGAGGGPSNNDPGPTGEGQSEVNTPGMAPGISTAPTAVGPIGPEDEANAAAAKGAMANAPMGFEGYGIMDAIDAYNSGRMGLAQAIGYGIASVAAPPGVSVGFNVDPQTQTQTPAMSVSVPGVIGGLMGLATGVPGAGVIGGFIGNEIGKELGLDPTVMSYEPGVFNAPEPTPAYGAAGYGMDYGQGYAHGGLAKLHQKYAEGGEVEDDGGVERYDPREIDALASEFMAESNPADLMQRARLMMRGMNVGMPTNVGALNLSDNENVSTYTGLREMPIEDDRFARALRTLNTGINATLDQERGIRLGAGLQALQDAGDRGMSGYGANLSAGYGPVSLHGGYQSQLQAYPGAKPQGVYTYGGNLNIPLDDEGAKALLGAQVMSGRRGSAGAGNAGTLITGGLERPFRGGTLGVDVSVDPTLRNKEILFGYRRAF